MDAKTLEALKASIAKWERNAEAKTPRDFKVGPEDCPLCNLFNAMDTADDTTCVGCPVFGRTGNLFCNASPYIPTWDIWHKWLQQPDRHDLRDLAHQRARDEVAFLKSLLPEETP